MSHKNIRFLITAGPTREFLDPVRYISNRSSGKMGYAIAAAARLVSPHVTLVSGPTALTPSKNIEFVLVTTAQEMADAVWSRFDNADICIMAAAVCDFRPKDTASNKLKKNRFSGTIAVEPTPDILEELGRRKKNQVLIGFAVETEDLEARAQQKLAQKHLDFIVANDAGAFDAETNRVTLIESDGRIERFSEMPKSDVAKILIERAMNLIRG